MIPTHRPRRQDDRTTDLAEVKAGRPYTWGEVIAVHEIGPYAVIEALPWTRSGMAVNTGTVDYEAPHNFHCYTDDRHLGHSFGSLEGAIAHCMAYKFDGANSQAAYFFCRMIGAPI